MTYHHNHYRSAQTVRKLGDYSRTEVSINRLPDGRFVIAAGATLDCEIGVSERFCFVCHKGRDPDTFANSAPFCNVCRANTKLVRIPKKQSAAEKAFAKYEKRILANPGAVFTSVKIAFVDGVTHEQPMKLTKSGKVAR